MSSDRLAAKFVIIIHIQGVGNLITGHYGYFGHNNIFVAQGNEMISCTVCKHAVSQIHFYDFVNKSPVLVQFPVAGQGLSDLVRSQPFLIQDHSFAVADPADLYPDTFPHGPCFPLAEDHCGQAFSHIAPACNKEVDTVFRRSEELLVYSPDGFRCIVCGHNSRNVFFRGSLGYGPDGDVSAANGLKHAAASPGLVFHIVANKTDN